MSRCFPFPPPGYEKTRTDDVDLLKKEKHKEKKHKKEKKDKEKKEKKEKREKDRSDEKRRDKKDKKEKPGDKKKDREKDRDRDRDKDKKSAVGEKKLLVQNECPNADKPISKERKHKDNNISSEENFSRQHAGYIREKICQSSHLVEESRDSKFIQEFDRRIKHDDGGGGMHMVQKFPVVGHKTDEATVKVMARDNAFLPEGKEKIKGIDNRKSDVHLTRDAQLSGNTLVQNHAGNFQPRVEGLPKPLGKITDKIQEGKESIKEKKDDKRGEKRKDRDKEEKGHGKDKDRDKKKKKKEKAKEQVEHKNSEHNKSKESNRPDPFHTNAVSGENLKKQKDIESNGVMNANDNWPNKLPRPSSHTSSENGRKLEPSRASVICASDSRQEEAINPKVDEKERKKNGIIEVRPFSVPSSKTVVESTRPNQIAGVPVKPPHPDTKYLKQVYLVPQMEIWSEFDDQEWLFSSSNSQLSKPRVETSGAGEIPLVWAEALQIEQADICALPYVIPY